MRAQPQRDLHADASQTDFVPFNDLEESVRQDVATLRSSPLIPADIPVTGFIYGVKTGRLEEVR